MTRGIHLKELRSADLDAIGVSNDGLVGATDGEDGRPLSLLAEADPVLLRTIDEVRQGLEKTLRHLDEALSTSSSVQEPPPRLGDGCTPKK